LNEGVNNGIEMRRLSNEEEGRGQSQSADEQNLEMAYNLVPGMEGLSERTGQ